MTPTEQSKPVQGGSNTPEIGTLIIPASSDLMPAVRRRLAASAARAVVAPMTKSDRLPSTSTATEAETADVLRHIVREQLLRADLTLTGRCYLRGRHLLLEKSMDCSGSLARQARSPRQRTRRAIAELLADDYGTDATTIIEDSKLAIAIDLITAACGQDARHFLLAADHGLSARTIGQISRCYPTRQCYELGEVAQGRRPFQKPAGMPVFDTHGFGEVLSRLRRAEGNLRLQVRVLQAATTPPPQALKDEMRRHADACLRAARQLTRLLGLRPKVCLNQQPTGKQLPARVKWGLVSGAIASARALIEKNVRDIPRMPQERKPNREDRRRISNCVVGIRRSASALVALLTSQRRNKS